MSYFDQVSGLASAHGILLEVSDNFVTGEEARKNGKTSFAAGWDDDQNAPVVGVNHITREEEYASALHEIGHVVSGHVERSMKEDPSGIAMLVEMLSGIPSRRRVEDEQEAWLWAFEHGEFTLKMLSHAEWALSTYTTYNDGVDVTRFHDAVRRQRESLANTGS